MDKIQKMIEAYNKKARKWGFDEIEIINGRISKPFAEKVNMNYGFFKAIKVLYQNGYMKEDYDKIKNALPPIKVEEPKPIEKKIEVKHEISIEEQAFANTFKG